MHVEYEHRLAHVGIGLLRDVVAELGMEAVRVLYRVRAGAGTHQSVVDKSVGVRLAIGDDVDFRSQ